MDIEQLLSPWKLGVVHMALQINNRLAETGMSWEDVKEYLNSGNARYKRGKDFAAISCPSCGRPMFLFSVNTNPANQVGGNYKSQWYCQRCSASWFRKETIEEEIKRVASIGRLKIIKQVR